jgi:signal transduction histidine kinase
VHRPESPSAPDGDQVEGPDSSWTSDAGEWGLAPARRQAAVAELGVRALGGLPLPELLQDAADVVRRTLDTEFVKILEVLPDGETARLVAGVGWRDGVVGTATIRVGHDSQAGYALLSHQPVIVEDLHSDPRLGDPPLLREHGVVSGMSVILYGPEGRSYGVLGAHTAQRRRFTTDDLNLLQGIANVLSAALHRQHVEDELRRAHAEAEAYATKLQEQASELEAQTEEAQSLAEELEQTNEALLNTTHEAERARQEAEAANRAKSDFLATMSHELRTPLNAIGGYTELLAMGLRGPVTEEQRLDLERIQRSQRHLLGLINDVLNFARLESGRVEYDVRPVLVADVVRDVWPMVEPLARAQGLPVDVRLPEDAGEPPIHVWADREKLGQVLLNLLSNAIKFTPARGEGAGAGAGNGAPGAVSVELSARADNGGAAAPDRAYLRVRDTGVGIPAAKLDAIFEPFVQVRSELTRQSGGTGLGLAISRDLARGMGGDLVARSTEGSGSTFTIVLRRVHAPGDAST